MNRVGESFHFGEGVPVNYASAREWYERAYLAGNDSAPHHIGRLYFNGEGVTVDKEEAFRWYERSALRGNLAAMSWMGHYYLEGSNAVAKDRPNGIAWFEIIRDRDPDGRQRVLYEGTPQADANEIDSVREAKKAISGRLGR